MNCPRQLVSHHIFISILSCAIASSAAAFDAAPALQAPVRCEGAASCGQDISLSEAEESYAEHKEMLSRQNGSATSAPTRLELYTPVPVIDRHICGEADVLGWYYFWAPAQDLIGGNAALEMLAEGLGRREPVDGFVYLQAAESSASERHFALCRVTTITGVNGPPRDCTTVAIALPERVWVRAGNRAQTWCNTASNFRASGAIQIEYEIATELNVSQIATAIAKALEARFKLAVDKQEERDSQGTIAYAYIRSTAGLRDSGILPRGWREALDVDVSVAAREAVVAVHGTVHALVSRQAVGSLTNYSGPNDAQRALYSADFDLGIGMAIQSICKTYQKLDAKRVVCK